MNHAPKIISLDILNFTTDHPPGNLSNNENLAVHLTAFSARSLSGGVYENKISAFMNALATTGTFRSPTVIPV